MTCNRIRHRRTRVVAAVSRPHPEPYSSTVQAYRPAFCDAVAIQATRTRWRPPSPDELRRFQIVSGDGGSRKSRLPVQAVGTTVAIVETLVNIDGATVAQLTAEIEQANQYRVRPPAGVDAVRVVPKADEDYRISARFLKMGARRRENWTLFEVDKPELERWADDTDEHADDRGE